MIRKKKVKKSKNVKVTFVLPGDHPYGYVSVVGSFNDWDASAHPLRRRTNDTYSAVVTLQAGQRYPFRYFSETEGWFNDNSADEYEPNGVGGENCVVVT